MPSRGSGLAQAVANTTFSPLRTTAEPWACFAQLPVSKETFLPPANSTVTSCFIGILFLQRHASALRMEIVRARQRLSLKDPGSVADNHRFTCGCRASE